MPKEIVLQNGMKVIVDEEDYDRANRYHWSARLFNRRNLFVSTALNQNGKKKEVPLHHFILKVKPEPSCCIIFENNNRLDFRKSNLKVVTRSYALQRIGARKKSSSKYKGVTWNKNLKKWVAQIHFEGKSKHIGHFDNQEEAALAYNEAARIYFGDHAYQNVLYQNNAPKEIKIPKALKRRNARKNDSKYRGVSKAKGKGRWLAKIKNKSIGVFDTEEEAAMAYNVLAVELFGDKAILNKLKKYT